MVKKFKNQSGLSLIEICWVIIIFGLIFVPGLAAIQYQMDREKVQNSKNRLFTIESVLKRYAILNGQYPRPAHRNLVPGTAEHGQQAELVDIVVCDNYAPSDSEFGKTCRIPLGGDNILIGALPIDELSLPLELSVDGYGGQFTYAVTESQTNNLNFRETPGDATTSFLIGEFEQGGIITVVDKNNAPLDDADASAHFVVFSHGPDQEGTFTINGVPTDACDNTLGRDQLNCDLTNELFTNNAALIGGEFTSERNYVTNQANYFDDYIVYASDTTQEIWSRVVREQGTTNVDIFSRVAGNIFLGLSKEETLDLDLPPPNARLAVQGNMKLEDSPATGPSRLMINRICEASPNTESFLLNGLAVAATLSSNISNEELEEMGYTRTDIDSPNYVIDYDEYIVRPRRNVDWSLRPAQNVDNSGGEFEIGDVVPAGFDEDNPYIGPLPDDDGDGFPDGVYYQGVEHRQLRLRDGTLFPQNPAQAPPVGVVTYDSYCDPRFENLGQELAKGVLKPSVFKVRNLPEFTQEKSGDGVNCDRNFTDALDGFDQIDEKCNPVKYNGDPLNPNDCAGQIPVGTIAGGGLRCVDFSEW